MLITLAGGIHETSPRQCLARSPSSGTSVDLQIMSSHVAARIAQHEQRNSPVLFRRADSPKHVVIIPLVSVCLSILEILFHHGCHDMARTERVDSNASGAIVPCPAELHGQVACQLNDCSFRGVVDRSIQPSVGDCSAHRSHEAHRTSDLVLEHLASARLCCEEHSGVVDFEHLGDVFWSVIDRLFTLLDRRSYAFLSEFAPHILHNLHEPATNPSSRCFCAAMSATVVPKLSPSVTST